MTSDKKGGPQRKDFGGRYGVPGFHRDFVSTTDLESFSLRPEKFPKRFSFGGGRVRFFPDHTILAGFRFPDFFLLCGFPCFFARFCSLVQGLQGLRREENPCFFSGDPRFFYQKSKDWRVRVLRLFWMHVGPGAGRP